MGGWFSDFGDKAAETWDIVVDASQNIWEEGKIFFNNAWDTTVDAFWNTMDWFEENKWAQTIVAGLLGANIVIGVIVIAVFAGIPIAIGAGAIALIIGGAIGAGFLYQWLAGDDYSFFGALTSSILGGALGFGAFIGSSSGAFAAAFTWGRVVALPWARGALRSSGRVIASGWRAAVGWIKGAGRATGRWITTKALPWIRSKFSLIVNGAVFGAVTGLLSNFIGVFFLGEEFSIKSLFIDIAIGAFSGGLLAAFLVGGVISTQILIGITAYGGLENWVSTGIKDGDWGGGNFIYGHKGSNEDKDKEVSCKSNELVYDMQAYDQTSLQDSLNQFKPTGFTPLANALTEAKQDLEKLNSDENTNIIYVVSDGVETCNGDPVAEAKKLAESDIQPIVNVIGFDVDGNGQDQLKEVAKVAKGLYADAKNQEQLKEELEKTQEIAKQWQEWKRDAVNGASSQRYEQMRKNIPRFGIEWGDANSFEKFNMRQPLNMLKDDGHISRTAFQLLSDKTSERYSHILELRNEVENDLRNVADQSFEEAREEINQKYNENSE